MQETTEFMKVGHLGISKTYLLFLSWQSNHTLMLKSKQRVLENVEASISTSSLTKGNPKALLTQTKKFRGK